MLAQNRVLDKDKGRCEVCILLFSWNISKPSRLASGGPEMGSGGQRGYHTVTSSSGMNAYKQEECERVFQRGKTPVA